VTELKEQVALTNRLLHHYGLTAYLGHASARIPGTNRVIIKARPHVSMDRVQAPDLMTVDLDDNVIEASKEYPTRVSEWPLHAEIYKARPDVGAVIHTHQKWCTILGIAGKTVLPVHLAQLAAVAAEPWPVYDESYAIVTDVAQARVAARLLGQHPACHLRTHGMVFVGPSLDRALISARNAEQQAMMTWHALVAGTPETIPMIFMREELERGPGPTQWEAREGALLEDWAGFQWMDEHPEVREERGVQF
jgi:ribulose-5-phosphate 4-epimerase/fuculose-1-phosphate aldolase